MKQTRHYKIGADGTAVRVHPRRGESMAGIVVVESGYPREIAGYRILSDRQLLKRTAPTLPLVEPDPYWTAA